MKRPDLRSIITAFAESFGVAATQRSSGKDAAESAVKDARAAASALSRDEQFEDQPLQTSSAA